MKILINTVIFILSLNQILCFSQFLSNNGRVICYLGSWATYRNGDCKFEVEDIDPFLCTHLIYSFAGLDKSLYTIKVLDPWQDLGTNYGKDGYNRAVKLKDKNPYLKVFLAVGGWNEGSVSYSQMASDSMKRKNFIESAINLLKEHNFDGLDLDWEYPASRGGSPEDKSNFIDLLRELHEALKENGMELSIAVGMGKETIEAAYHISEVNKYVDLINMMTYDFRGSWDGKTGHHTQLYSKPNDFGNFAYYNLNSSIHLWIEGGADKSKLNVGLAFYGRTYTVPQNNGQLGVPSTGGGRPGPCTQQSGILGYNEICLELNTGGWTTTTDQYVKAPWSYKDQQFIAYDSPDSIYEKACWAMNLGLGGTMFWSIETDDFRGKCNQGRYPLLRAINNCFDGRTTPLQPTTTTNTSTLGTESTTDHGTVETTAVTQTAPSTTISSTSSPEECNQHGLLKPDLENCSKYFICTYDVNGELKWVQLSCGDMFFDPTTMTCVIECPWLAKFW